MNNLTKGGYAPKELLDDPEKFNREFIEHVKTIAEIDRQSYAVLEQELKEKKC